MKKAAVLILTAFLLSGCGVSEAAETVADEWVVPVMAEPRQIALDLPGEASVCAMESDSGRLYIGDGYEVALQTVPAGDLNATLHMVTGFWKDALTVLQTEKRPVKRYEFVWAAAGEKGEQLGRGVILDDGAYHYCLSVLRDAEEREDCQVVWDQVFHSFALV